MSIIPNPQKNIETIRQVLEDEIRGDISSALEKMTNDYSMTWVYKRKDGILFPKITSEQVRAAMKCMLLKIVNIKFNT